LQILEEHDNDITADQIYLELDRTVDPGRTQESIRKIIRDLANDEDHLVGSSSKGFFKIKTKADAERAIKYLQSRIPKIENRAESLRQKWNETNLNDKI